MGTIISVLVKYMSAKINEFYLAIKVWVVFYLQVECDWEIVLVLGLYPDNVLLIVNHLR